MKKLTKDEQIRRLAESAALFESANRTLLSGNNALRSALREAYWALPAGAADRLQARYPAIVGGFIAEQEEAEERLSWQKARELVAAERKTQT